MLAQLTVYRELHRAGVTSLIENPLSATPVKQSQFQSPFFHDMEVAMLEPHNSDWSESV